MEAPQNILLLGKVDIFSNCLEVKQRTTLSCPE
jgi:hypothetical protein